MKKLLLIIPLLFGCAREWECDLEYIDADGELFDFTEPNISSYISPITATEDWPYGGEAEVTEECERMHNAPNQPEKGFIHCNCVRR